MNLMERNKRTVLLGPPPSGKDADAAAAAPSVPIRAVVTPLLKGQRAYPFGIIEHERAQLLYDGPVGLCAGMRAVLRPGEADAAEYVVRSVRRYPWLQAAELSRARELR